MSPMHDKSHASHPVSSARPMLLNAAVPPFGLPEPISGGGKGDNNVFEDATWKEQRKLKHQRDLHKRHGPRKQDPTMKSNARGTPTRHPGRSPSFAPADRHADHRGRNIPARRKEKSAMSPLLLSKSVPPARSWPPDKDGSDFFDEQSGGSNWSLNDSSSMASSAPEESFLSSSYGSRRGARTMTLFESASLFNESGHLLSHDNFNEMGTSPEIGSYNRRKSKRRVGRHKQEKAKIETSDDRLTPDEVVLELMHFLLPDVEVTKELNMLFLGGSRHHGDVFDFDDEDVDRKAKPRRNQFGSHAQSKLLEVDVMKFQASLAMLMFGKDDPDHDLPLAGTPADELVEQMITDQWISKAFLRIVKLDVAAQYDAFAVIAAIFRTLPARRSRVLKTAVTACLAIFDHQGMKRLNADGVERPVVSMKGVVSFLSTALMIVEVDSAENIHIFGSHPEEIDECLGVMCDSILDAVKLLVRSSPAQRSKSDDNQLEKYQEDSESVEATTYSAIGELVYRLTSFSPMHGEEFLTWMLRKWPQRNVQLQLFYVRFMAGVLTQCMSRGIFLSVPVVSRVFSRIRMCIQSPHFMIAKEASSVCGNIPLVGMYLSNDQTLREQVSAALHENATGHWNDRIREMSDEYFDLLLDFA
ncbi:hypothetical protein Poli38472_000865 [Pythium oligandrum]|uniref:Uncharacterized protein n=1 Tax=Pythium oligandrum TaxID=41045 RepID=A0A8K1FJK3_PYTOL|nr:hypothetical protein Poli38472_000865 [Pythium oligandrum]|eukprot:TMW60823.1 hypothetical protein Poli38472_000865 [Pythium oligandrum]